MPRLTPLSPQATRDLVLTRGRLSVGARVHRLRSKAWHIGQAAIAAGVAWLLAADVLGHDTPFFRPIAAGVSVGTSLGQRRRAVDGGILRGAVSGLGGGPVVVWVGWGWWRR